MNQDTPAGSTNPAQRHYPPTPKGSLRELVRNPLSYFQTITRELGDIVCYRPAPDPAYLLNHPDYVRHVLIENHRNYSKETYSIQAFKKVMGDGLITAEGDAWLWQRRLMQPAFHHARLEILDSLIVQATHEMLGHWEQSCREGQPVDIAREMAALTLSVTARALFGVDLGERVKSIGEIVNRAATMFEKPSSPTVQQSALEFREVVDDIIRTRRESFRDGGDLLSSLMLARDEQSGLGMDDRQLSDQLMGLLLAGYETTANSLTWTWYLLAENPWAGKQMREEVRQALDGRAPTAADVERIPYLRQVLDESLRLYPPAWMIGRRAIGEDMIGGYDVPAGTVIAICAYTLHRHPAFWDEPGAFNPDRFAAGYPGKRHKFAYIPFGAGPRQCIGNTFGLLEASLILACVAQRYELRLAEGSQVEPQALFVLRPNRDLMMRLIPRPERRLVL